MGTKNQWVLLHTLMHSPLILLTCCIPHETNGIICIIGLGNNNPGPSHGADLLDIPIAHFPQIVFPVCLVSMLEPICLSEYCFLVYWLPTAVTFLLSYVHISFTSFRTLAKSCSFEEPFSLVSTSETPGFVAYTPRGAWTWHHHL